MLSRISQPWPYLDGAPTQSSIFCCKLPYTSCITATPFMIPKFAPSRLLDNKSVHCWGSALVKISTFFITQFHKTVGMLQSDIMIFFVNGTITEFGSILAFLLWTLWSLWSPGNLYCCMHRIVFWSCWSWKWTLDHAMLLTDAAQVKWKPIFMHITFLI